MSFACHSLGTYRHTRKQKSLEKSRLFKGLIGGMATIKTPCNALNLLCFILLQNTVTVSVTVTKTAKNSVQKKALDLLVLS